MIDFTVHTTENAPEESRSLLAMAEEKMGFIPNIFLQMAESPATLNATLHLLAFLEASSLTPEEQKVVLLETAFQVSSDYCVAANSTVAKMSDVAVGVIESIRSGKPLDDARLEALRRFTGEMATNRGVVSADTKKQFFNAGFNNAHVFEVILGIATETMASYTDRVAGVPVDDLFSDYAWSRPATEALNSA